MRNKEISRTYEIRLRPRILVNLVKLVHSNWYPYGPRTIRCFKKSIPIYVLYHCFGFLWDWGDLQQLSEWFISSFPLVPFSHLCFLPSFQYLVLGQTVRNSISTAICPQLQTMNTVVLWTSFKRFYLMNFIQTCEDIKIGVFNVIPDFGISTCMLTQDN